MAGIFIYSSRTFRSVFPDMEVHESASLRYQDDTVCSFLHNRGVISAA